MEVNTLSHRRTNAKCLTSLEEEWETLRQVFPSSCCAADNVHSSKGGPHFSCSVSLSLDSSCVCQEDIAAMNFFLFAFFNYSSLSLSLSLSLSFSFSLSFFVRLSSQRGRGNLARQREVKASDDHPIISRIL